MKFFALRIRVNELKLQSQFSLMTFVIIVKKG